MLKEFICSEFIKINKGLVCFLLKITKLKKKKKTALVLLIYLGNIKKERKKKHVNITLVYYSYS